MAGVELKFLGTGTCALHPKTSSACYVVDIDGNPLVLDLGNGAEYRLFQAGYSYRDIDYIAISHAHPDHISDITMMLQSMLYTPFYERTRPLYIIGPPMVFRYLDMMQEFYAGAFNPRSFEVIRIVLRDGEEFDAGTFQIQARTMNHFVDALGYRITTHGITIAYSGDTDLCKGVEEICKDADVAMLDASFLRSQKKTLGHMSVFECGQVAAKANVRRLVLTHRNPIYEANEAIAEVRDAGFFGEVLLPFDGQSLKLT